MRAIAMLLVLSLAVASAGLSGFARARSIDDRGRADSEAMERARALSPDDAQAMLLLGEDLGDSARATGDVAQREDAIVLLVTAHERARANADNSTRVSALLALADVLPTQVDRDRVRTLAGMLMPQGVRSARRATAPSVGQSVDYLVSEFLGKVRSGDGARARAMLRRSDVRERLLELDTTLVRAGISGGAQRVLREAERWPCPLCANEGIERPRGRSDGVLCSHCKGAPGPALSQAELLAWLRVEALLVRVEHAGWAAQHAFDRGEPLRILDDDELPRWLHVRPLELLSAGQTLPEGSR